jgi:hypothetical protein
MNLKKSNAESLISKLTIFSDKQLNDAERQVLDGVLGLYLKAVEEKNLKLISGGDRGFLDEIKAARPDDASTKIAVTTITTSSSPCITTVTITTTLASHPIITCD